VTKTVRRLRDTPQEVAFRAFADHLQELKSRAAATVRCYLSDLKHLSAFSRTHLDGRGALDLQEADLARYVDNLRVKGMAARTAARRVSTIKSFYHFLRAAGIIDKDPSLALVPPRVKVYEPATISPTEALGILAVGSDDYQVIRNRAVALTVYGCGVLPSELVGLDVRDVDFCGRRIHVRGRAGQRRDVPMGTAVARALRVHVSARRGSPSQALFLNLRGARLTTRTVANIVRRSFRQKPNSVVVTSRTLRHSFASHLLDNWTSVAAVQQLLGHRYWSTQRAYHGLLKEQGRIRPKLHHAGHKKPGKARLP